MRRIAMFAVVAAAATWGSTSCHSGRTPQGHQDADGDQSGDLLPDSDGDTDGGDSGDGGDPLPGDSADCDTIMDARTAATGTESDGVAVDLSLCNVLVAYVAPTAYFIQEGPTGPGIQVYEGVGSAAGVAVGDRISLHVTHVADYNGNEEITEHDAPVIDSSDNVVQAQDLSLGVFPSEDLEAELVAVSEATVDALTDRDVTISYGTATGVPLRVPATSAPLLCAGATIDVLAPVTEWEPDGIHRIEAFTDADLPRIDSAACGGSGRTPAPGDLVINEFLADPPSDGDPNCDGTFSTTTDEFVEIVNVSSEELDLSGVTIADSISVRYTFAVATSLPVGAVVLVFGGGNASCTWPQNVQAFVSTGLRLNNADDTITVATRQGVTITTISYIGGDDNASQTLHPDLNVTGGYVLHNTVAATPFSPGRRTDGTPFP